MCARNSSPPAIRFGPYVVKLRSGELFKDGAQVRLQEQPFKILTMLLARPGEVVTRDELRARLWTKDTYVDYDHGINVSIARIREALDDSSAQPQFIATVGRRGYRFIAAVEPISDRAAPSTHAIRGLSNLRLTYNQLVGREKENAQLESAFESVEAGHGLLLSVSGEPGIGKTTLVQDFLAGLQARGKIFGLAIGRCSQRLAGEEAYLPFLEALDSLLRGDSSLTRKLRDLAPSWYAQLFPLSGSDPSDAALQAHARATTQERVKRELAAFLCEITRQSPLVLFFDDVHWTDPSTVDLLAHLATKFDIARILVIVTYRPSELFLLQHPLVDVKRDLLARSVCREIEVEFLLAKDVERYIALEFLGNSFPREFAGLVHSKTEGNPLFMVDLLRYLRDRKVIVKAEGKESWRLARSLPDLSRDMPQSVSSVIERKVHQLSDRDREVLTTAAVLGYEFDSAALARALEAAGAEIEEILDRVERVHAFVKRVGEDELPGGAPTVRYRFVHVLYQNALYAALAPSRRMVIGAALAQALEGLYGDRISTIASQLAFLYETACDPGRASDYFLLAAQSAQRIFANQEAIALAQHGLALLDKIPDSPERTGKELGLQVTLGFSFLCTRGYAAPETGTSMGRARELCRKLGDTASLFPVLFGLWTYYLCKGDLKSARGAAELLSSLSRDLNDPTLSIMAHATVAFTLHALGELVESRQQFEEVSRLYDVTQHSRYVQLYRLDPGLHSASEMTRTLWLLGYPDQARRKVDETLALASSLSSPLSLAFCQLFAVWLYQWFHEPERAKAVGDACIALCDEQAIMLERAWVVCPYGLAIAELGRVEEGIAHIRAGLDIQLSIGSQIARTQCLANFAEALLLAGRREESLGAVEEALTVSDRAGEGFYLAELWRLRGELVKMQGNKSEAESCLQRAIEIARQQAAKSLELRASASLARLWQGQGKHEEAREILAGVYSWFTEGFDTADLKEAASLLGKLS